MEIPVLPVTEKIERLLIEAKEKTGKTEEEILQLCLELGILKILEETEPAASQRGLQVG